MLPTIRPGCNRISSEVTIYFQLQNLVMMECFYIFMAMEHCALIALEHCILMTMELYTITMMELYTMELYMMTKDMMEHDKKTQRVGSAKKSEDLKIIDRARMFTIHFSLIIEHRYLEEALI